MLKRLLSKLLEPLQLSILCLLILIGIGIGFGPVIAQQINGTLGSPTATISISGKQLPPPPGKFAGVIKPSATESKPYWQPRVVPPKGAPNVLLIMTDDSGFGVPSTFGGVIPTPTLDLVAQNGLRYTNFNSTALCSPTRAALLTGRNHHSVGFGVISEQSTGFPGYDSIITRDKATIGRILKDNGYWTSWFGKDHNVPAFQSSQAGPFDQWPTGMGFDYFYGFVGGDANQWQPNLFRNTTAIYPYVGNPKWNLITAQADDAIQQIRRVRAANPDQPLFVNFVPGGTHAPHHPTPEWIDKISKLHLFDEGWNKLREQIFENQKKLGVIPQDAQLTPWPKDLLKEWDQLTPDDKKMFIRQADVFAAYVAYTDHEIGRVIQELDNMGELENTLIIYINGDNGTSAEGTMVGTPNEVAIFNGVEVPVEDQLKYFYDAWGSDRTYPHMAIGWAWAFDTPFSWTKQVASHFGGVRQGMAISWPARIKDKGGIRNQFHHVIDILPTVLEVSGISQPDVVDGIPQSPIEGVSLAYTFDKSNTNIPSSHKTQYFEMFGDRALYHDGWIASTKVVRPPWQTIKPAPSPLKYPWELYKVTEDWTQNENVADKYPDKLKELQNLFMQEAEKYQVLPLDNTVFTRLLAPRPSLSAGRNVFTYSGVITGTPHGDAPNILDSSYNFKADVNIPSEGGDGMIVTQGGRFGGYGFYILKGKPVFVWNLFNLKRIRWEGAETLPPGKHTLEFDFRYDGLGAETLAFNQLSGVGAGGTGVLKVDEKTVATQKMEHTVPFTVAWDENFDVGADTITSVDDKDYQVPFQFNGQLNKLVLTIDRPKLSPADIQKLEQSQRNNRVSE